MTTDTIISLPGIGTISLLELERSIDRDKCRQSMKEFVHSAWSLVEPNSPLGWNWHLDEFCSVLESVYRGEIKRLIVNVPPGSSKSLFFSVFFNAWVWANNPSKRFLTASYTPDLTIRDNLRLRSIVQSEWYIDRFGVKLSSDQNAKERFETTEKGWRIASSVGGVATGEHPDFLIVDDPLKVLDARSEAKRKEANNWIDGTISTRTRLDPAIVLIMQRLHEDDPSGHLLAKGGWMHFCLPMHYIPEKKDNNDLRTIPSPRDHRTVKGQLLWPEVWNEEKVAKAELLLGHQAPGQLEQGPIPEGGLLYEREWFEYVDKIWEEVDECRGWDIAETDEMEKSANSANWTVGVKLAKGRRTGYLYVRDVIRVQKTFVDELMKSTAKMDGTLCKIREGSGSGKATIKARSILLAGYDYAASPETAASGDKIQRNNPFRAYAQSRNVKIVKAEWNEIYLSVLCSFPLGKCDDDVDATSNAANELFGEGEEWFTW